MMAETSTRTTTLDFSPGQKDDFNKENNVPVLSLIQFSKAPFITFGTFKLGTSKSAVLRIENPAEDVEAEVTVEKIPSSKGFSVDHRLFTIQPEGFFNLTVTWTPTEEGGVRELITFSANGVLKHQAIMLGRAEAPKKKKKSLWDSIKSKKEGEKVGVPRGKKPGRPTKMTANKTFQVSREPQYKRVKPRSPLASLNKGEAARERLLVQSPIGNNSEKYEEQHPVNSKVWQQNMFLTDQENVHHFQRNSPVVLLVPATKVLDSGGMSASPDVLSAKPENKNIFKVLNKTISPIGTPERFKKLIPHIESESPAPTVARSAADANCANSELAGNSAFSLANALALIDSDLSQIETSPGDSSSLSEFSDSLESKSDSRVPDRNVLKQFPNSPELSESNEPRLTFFVSKKVVLNEAVVSVENDVSKSIKMVKKACFTSATVTKSKGPVEEKSLSGRKIKKSRRRLLEKTLELTDSSSQHDSGPDTPKLPVIFPDARNTQCLDTVCDETNQFSSSPTPCIKGSTTTITFPLISPSPVASHRFSFSVNSPPRPSIPLTVTSPSPQKSSSRLRFDLPSTSCKFESRCPAVPLSPAALEHVFPVQMVAKTKKRKSEEYLKSDPKMEEAMKADRVKRSKVVTGKTQGLKSLQEKRAAAAQRQQQPRAAGSNRSTASSLKSSRSAVPVQTKRQSAKLASRVTPSLKLSSSIKTSRVVAVAQSKLTFVKPTQTAIPRHPMPFAAKNMFFDERWIEKQERGFTWWINYVLTPDDFRVNTEVAKVNAVSLAMGTDDNFSVPKAPTKEEVSFSTYTARRKLNRLRRSACQLFTSETMVKAIQRLELEVESKRLLVRKDRHLWKDIGERQKVLKWLLSYNPLWLRIGLETIFGELISLESNSDALGLAMFILQRLLWNADIAAEFRHAKVPNLYKEGHEEALSRFTLKKLLLLVCFLDKAKESRLIEHDPCLFCVDAEFKTSKDLLLAFSRDFLSGEGILPRHLGYLGLPVSHAQKPLDEFDFAVKNLAVDLRCGIRLVRVMELLTQDWSLSPKLRLPAISRLQKVHNTDVALQVLKSKGVDLKDEQGTTIDSRDIVDGHREKTLSLLWKLIFAFQVEVILDESLLREEIAFLRRTLRIKRRLDCLRADRGLRSTPTNIREPYDHSSTKISLLMDWARAVCDFYSLKVENFTVTFSDGRVLCHLIHHYHPGLLPEEAVSHSTTQTMECSPRGRLELSCSASDSDSSFDSVPPGLEGTDSPSVLFKELLENERNNFRLVNTAVADLGGVPAMINPADMSNTIPNEKVVMSYLTFLCARLLDLRNETRAARVIQGAWRKYRLKKDLQVFKERNMAAVKIQLLVRSFLQRRRAVRQNQAALVIQSFWRGRVTRVRLRRQKEAELRALQNKAATVIQAHWRMLSTLRSYQHLRYHAIIVQAQWRMKMAARAYGKLYWAATVLQTRWRALAVARGERERYLSLRAAVGKLQRGYRRWKACKSERENNAARVIQGVFRKWYGQRMAHKSAAAAKIQSWFRTQKCLCQYRKIKRSALLIQALYRGHAQRRRFEAAKLQQRSAVVIQRAVRGHAVRKRVARMRSAAVLIQRWFRATLRRDEERQEFVRLRRAAVTIQAAYRGNVAREFVKKQQKAALLIQAAFRRHAAQSRYVAMRKAAVVIQQKYRANILARKTMKDFEALRNAVVVIQANWRGSADRKNIKYRHSCATVIQAHYRRHKMQVEYRAKKAAAVIIQRQYRAFAVSKKAREAFLCEKKACVTLQAAFRGMRARAELRRKHQAATIIQSTFKMFSCRNRYILLQSASVIIQSRYRALLLCRAQQKEYSEMKQAAVKFQALYRGFRVREELKYRNKAARTIQAQFRMYRIRMIYLATKCAAIIVQERFRAQILRNQQLQTYRTMKSAAVTIQKVFRGHIVRRKVTEMHRAAAVIQRRFLAFKDRRKFLAVKSAASFCQRRYRAVSLARKDRLDFLSKRRAATCLQAAYRGHKVREQLRVQHMAAVTVQAHFRAHKQRSHYRRLRWAASVLQARYRANKTMRQEVHKLSAKRHATVVLQAAYRGMKCRQAMKQKSRAVGVIQRAYKAHCERRQYLALRSSVLIIQRRYRATVAAKEHVQKYQKLRSAAIALQAAYRGWQVRKKVARWHQAATLIQSVFKKHREEVKFQAMRLSAVIIQRYYRACVLQRKDRENYLEVKHAAVVLQATFRGQRVRRHIAKMHQAATLIQANFRRHKEQSYFRKQRWAACVLQKRFRAKKQKDLDSKHYQMTRDAAIMLQAAYRGWQVRQEVAHWHRAATLIQSVFRKHREDVKFQAMRLSAVIIQRYYRAFVLQRKDRENFLKVRHAAIVLQATFRGLHVRRNIDKMHKSATVIQANFRRYMEQSRFRKQRWAACVLQKRFRAKKQKDLDSKHYQMIRDAAIMLQAVYRGWQVRREVAHWHRAATLIQSVFRKHREEVKFQAMRLSAVIIQRSYRAFVLQRKDRENFLKVRHAAVVLQAAYRGLHVRRDLNTMHKSATVIQANFRRHKEQSHFRRQRWAASVLQERFRAKKQKELDSKNYQMTRDAAIVLQAAYRGMKTRRGVKRSHLAASVIQRAFMAHCEQRRYLALKTAVLTIQRRYRANVSSKKEVQKYKRIQSAAVTLQAAHRGWQVRKEVAHWHQAATLIQSVFRKHREEVKFQAMRLSAIIIQRYYRAFVLQRKDREHFLTARGAAVVLQATFRGQRVRRNITKMHQAATLIQANFRRHKEQSQFRRQRWAACVLQQRFRGQRMRDVDVKNYQELRKAVVSLQAAVRGLNARRKVKLSHRCATVIQRAYRAHREHKQYLQLKSSVLNIQRKYRATLAAKQQRMQYLEMHSAAVVLQAAYKGHRVRMEVTRWHWAAAVIQSQFRKHREEIRFRAMRLAAIVIQRHYRSCVAQRKEREVFLRKRKSSIILQAAFRGWCVRREIGRQNRSAVVVQSHWRGSLQRLSFQRKRAAALTIQRRFKAMQRGRAERNNYTRMRQAAITLQTHFRAWRIKRQLQEAEKAKRRFRFTSAVFHHLSAIKIQRALRAHWALESAKKQIHCVLTIQRWVRARQQRRRYLEDRRKVVIVQWVVRSWLAHRHKAAAVIQQAVRKFLLVRRNKRIQEGIVKAQALWRGHRSRRLNDNPKVVKLRRRLREVTAAAKEEDKLCNKTSSSLDYLLKCKHISYILEALKNLETATRLSPECCERLVNSGATNTIFTLIRCCNRSVPCMDMITFSIQILLNLSKYHKTIEAVYCVDKSVETLLDLLQRYREKAGDKVADKGGSLFTKTCFLVALLLQDKDRAVEVMKLPKALDRIRSIYRLTARKHKMDAERTVIKQKMNASINGSFLVPPTPRKSRTAPKFAPDWVLRKDKLKDIVDPLRAIQMVADTLSIVL